MRVTNPDTLTTGDVLFYASNGVVHIYEFVERFTPPEAGCRWEPLCFARFKYRSFNDDEGTYAYYAKVGRDGSLRPVPSVLGPTFYDMFHEHSLHDMGIIPNNYNDHATFTTVVEARNHVMRCHHWPVPGQESVRETILGGLPWQTT